MGCKTGFAVLICVPLAGCVAVWGNDYKVSFANSSAVTIEYDPASFPTARVNRAAQAECDKYQKDAVLDRTTPAFMGILTASYRCQPRLLPRQPAPPPTPAARPAI